MQGILIAFLALPAIMSDLGLAEDIVLKAGKAVHFEGIPRNKFTSEGSGLSIQVQESSSLWLIPFAKTKQAEKVMFEFMLLSEQLEQNSKGSKNQKSQDDWPLRVGLLVFGQEPFVPFFAPAWVKAIRAFMKHPSDRILNITPSIRFSGQKWESPYADSIMHVAVPYQSKGNKHQVTYFVPKESQTLVGVWIQSDGDDLKRSFSIKLHHLKLN